MTNQDSERVASGAPDDRAAANHMIGLQVLDEFGFLANTAPGSTLARQSLAELTRTLDQYDLRADLDFVITAMKAGHWRG